MHEDEVCNFNLLYNMNKAILKRFFLRFLISVTKSASCIFIVKSLHNNFGCVM